MATSDDEPRKYGALGKGKTADDRRKYANMRIGRLTAKLATVEPGSKEHRYTKVSLKRWKDQYPDEDADARNYDFAYKRGD